MDRSVDAGGHLQTGSAGPSISTDRKSVILISDSGTDGPSTASYNPLAVFNALPNPTADDLRAICKVLLFELFGMLPRAVCILYTDDTP